MSTDHSSILNEIIAMRRSIRKFKPDPVPRPLILKLLEAARLAPSASNRQPWRFYIVADQESKEKLRRSGAVHQGFVLEAPLCIVCCADMKSYSTKDTKAAMQQLLEKGALDFDNEDLASYWSWWSRVSQGKDLLKLAYLDLGIAIEHIVLMAEAAGLGACWMRRIDEEEVAKALNLPREIVVVAFLALGYPLEDPPQRPRKALNSLLLNPEQI